MDIKDIAGLSKPLTRLIEVVANGIGAVSRPYLIRRTSEAKAHEINVISSALKSATEATGGSVIYKDGDIEAWSKPEDATFVVTDINLEERFEKRIEYQERKRQNNVELITSIAASNLVTDTDVPEEMPDEDWVSRFFNSAQDVSSEQMQELWGRILAGEIRRPGSFSMKTLDFFRNTTKHDAELIQLLAPLTVKINGSYVIPIPDKKWQETNRSIYPKHYITASELGVLYPTELQNRFFYLPEQTQSAITAGDRLLLINKHEATSELQLPIWNYTKIGSEIFDLISSDPDIEHMIEIGKFFINRKARAQIGRIIGTSRDGKNINYTEIEEVKTI
jgi:hypothetical protein